MFWWLYTVTSQPASTRPLVMWLQGGPGGCASLTCCSSPQIRLLTPLAPHPAIAASTGIGNFGEFGPLDVNQQPRNNTWLQAANLLFLDQPVGTGYSYVDNPAPGGQLTTNNTQIANDVVTLLQAFTAAFPATKTAPFFIMTESYGGKMGSAIALAILAAVDAGSLSLSFKGIGIGDSWINGVSYVDAWGPYLHAVQVFDDRDLAEYVVTSDKCDAAVAAGNWSEAINLWGDAENVIENLGDGVNFYNVIFQQDPCVGWSFRRVFSPPRPLTRPTPTPHPTPLAAWTTCAAGARCLPAAACRARRWRTRRPAWTPRRSAASLRATRAWTALTTPSWARRSTTS